MEPSYHSFLAVWKDMLVDNPGKSLLRITRTSGGDIINYRGRSLFSRAHRFASGFAEKTNLVPGDRVAVLVGPTDELAIILHGLWLLKLSVVIIDWKKFSTRLVDEFDELRVKSLVVDTDSRSKVAGLLASVPTLKSWFVVGADPAEEPSHRYEPLLTGRIDQQLTSDDRVSDAEALILYSEDHDGRVFRSIFSQSSLCLQGQVWQQHFPDNSADDQLAFVSAEPASFEFNFFNFIAPLFSGVPFLMDEDISVKRLWEHVKSDGLNWIYLSQADLLAVLKRGRPSLWSNSENLVVYVGTEQPLASSILEEFEDTFSVLVHTTFARAELGGVVSIFPQNLGREAHHAWLLDQEIPSSGMLLDHLEVKFMDEFGYEVTQAIQGQLYIRMIGSEDWIQTGLDGFYAEDNKDRSHIFIYGDHQDGILRFGQYINLSRIDAAIKNLRGVAFGMSVGFSNVHAGLEVGAYIVPIKAIEHQVDEQELLKQLQLVLSAEECPKVIVRGAYPRVFGDWPKRADVLKAFNKFRKIDFSAREP